MRVFLTTIKSRLKIFLILCSHGSPVILAGIRGCRLLAKGPTVPWWTVTSDPHFPCLSAGTLCTDATGATSNKNAIGLVKEQENEDLAEFNLIKHFDTSLMSKHLTTLKLYWPNRHLLYFIA